MCKTKDLTETKIDRLIASMDRLSEALEKQQMVSVPASYGEPINWKEATFGQWSEAVLPIERGSDGMLK